MRPGRLSPRPRCRVFQSPRESALTTKTAIPSSPVVQSRRSRRIGQVNRVSLGLRTLADRRFKFLNFTTLRHPCVYTTTRQHDRVPRVKRHLHQNTGQPRCPLRSTRATHQNLPRHHCAIQKNDLCPAADSRRSQHLTARDTETNRWAGG